MKKNRTPVFLSAIAALAFTFQPPSGRINLVWDYPYPAPLAFNIYASPNVSAPLTNWVLFTNVPGTSTDGTNTWTTTNVSVTITPGQMFFFCTASNSFWESIPSNVCNTPPLPPMPPGMSITRTN